MEVVPERREEPRGIQADNAPSGEASPARRSFALITVAAAAAVWHHHHRQRAGVSSSWGVHLPPNTNTHKHTTQHLGHFHPPPPTKS
jgi:hypothetical protein